MRRPVTVPIPALVCTVLLSAGCGIGATPDTGANFDGKAAALGASGTTPDVLADRLECTNFSLQVTDQPTHWQRGACELQGRQLRLHSYTDVDFRTLIRQQGPESVHVVGENWLVEAPDRALAGTVAERLGGQVQ